MGVVAFPSKPRATRGCIHVVGNQADGFDVAHESESGDSWGSFSGPYRTGRAAIDAALALNRDTYEGVCELFVCDAATTDATLRAAPLSFDGDF